MKPIRYAPAALKALGKLPKPARLAILAEARAVRRIGRGKRQGARRPRRNAMRVGDHRVVFVEMADAIEVLTVGHQRDVCE